MAPTEDSIGVALSPATVRVVRIDRRSRRVTASARAALGYADWDEMRAHAGECARALAGLSAHAGLRRGGCVATLPYSRGRAEVVALPPMKMREIRRITASPQLWRRHFGVTSGTHNLGWQVLSRGADGRVSLLLTAAPKEDVAFCRDLFADAGLQLRVAGLACLDYYYAACRAESPRRFLVLDECDAYIARFSSCEFDVAPIEVTAFDRACILDENADATALNPALANLAAPLRRREGFAPAATGDVIEGVIDSDAESAIEGVAGNTIEGGAESAIEGITGNAIEGATEGAAGDSIEGTAGDTIKGAAGDTIEDTAKSTIEVFFPLGEQALNTRLALLQKHLPETHFTPIATTSAAPAPDMSRAFALAHWQLPPPRPRFRRAPPHTAPSGFIVREAPDYRTAAVHCAVSVMLAFALAIWQTELRSQNEALAAHTQRHAALAAEHRRHASTLEEAERRLAHWRRVVEAADALFKRQKDIPALLETLGGAVSAGLRLERLDCISPQVCRLTGFAPSYERIAAFAETLEQAHGVSRVIVGGVTPGGTDAAGRPEKRFELECRLHTGAEAA
ncbi:MAG: PilN domain-containing protein [Gammaproteobacteria bacterium]|nr:PilN domain-containing protein [Gammaproteobacteria bacterium]